MSASPFPEECVGAAEVSSPTSSQTDQNAHAASNSPEAKPPVDLATVSVQILGHKSRTVLSMHMNPYKMTGSDWKGLADYMGFTYLEIENFALRSDPMGEALREWQCKKGSTVAKLKGLLQDLERDDVLGELEKPIRIDVERWRERTTDTDQSTAPVQVPEVSGTSYPNKPVCPELRGITTADHPSGPVETFDAYICHNSDTDYEFVQEIIGKMEKSPYNLRFCTDWRNLVPGGSYATVTAELIENRCKRMIVILSPSLLDSEHCDFHTRFALSLSPGARNKRMVLIMLKACEVPSILRHITVCDYTKEALRSYFWDRLYASLKLS